MPLSPFYIEVIFCSVLMSACDSPLVSATFYLFFFVLPFLEIWGALLLLGGLKLLGNTPHLIHCSSPAIYFPRGPQSLPRVSSHQVLLTLKLISPI